MKTNEPVTTEDITERVTEEGQDQTQEEVNEELNANDDEFQTNWEQIVENFDDMGLKEELLRGVYAYGFERPSAIQQRGILPVVMGRDTIAQAQSGTGKTATFVISSLQIIDLNVRECQVLILAPTRELAQQIHKVTIHLGDYLKITSHACVGGTAVQNDVRVMQSGIQMVVGTPGRVNDMINRSALKLDNLRLFVLDEADEMLSRGFKDQIYDVFQYLPANVQVCLFFCYHAFGNSKLNQSIHANSCENPCQKGTVDFGWYQTVLRCCRT